jgi:zona occludens toxin
MAINVYTGLPGSGKSYEVVSEVIAKQVAAGRRIVTNIDGINPEEVFDYAVDKLGAEVGKLGKIAKVTDVDVQKPDFFPGEDINVASFCNRGDIIVIDEGVTSPFAQNCTLSGAPGERLGNGPERS